MEEINVPKSTGLDTSFGLGKAIVEALPAGSLLSFVVQQFLQAPLDKRMQAFFEQVAQRLNEHGQQLEALTNNDRFTSNLLQAANIALRNHDNEKLGALRNAVINSINPPSYDESLQTVFLNLIDRFTPWHLKVLITIGDVRIFSGPNAPFGRPSSISRIERVHHFFVGHQAFLELILIDLKAAFLIQHNWDGGQSIGGIPSPENVKVTEIGKQFIDFILEPKEKVESQENRTA